MASRLSGSIIVPAHNEASVIRRTLRPLAGLVDDGIELIVVANGCSDATAHEASAAAPGATVIETSIPSKTHAIRLGELAATAMPRLYVDADVVLTPLAAKETLSALAAGAIAARPPLVYDSEAATWPVQCYYRARRAMPSLYKHAWGAGVYGLSRSARSRFDEFPDVVGDDLWVDSLLRPGELVVVPTDPVVVSTPRDSSNLLGILRRGMRSKDSMTAMKQNVAGTERSTARDLLAVARSGPHGVVDAAVYAGFAVAARLTDRRSQHRWERDVSSRT